ncbi:MAG: SdpI family protein [Myxococcales bacterium]|nr:SdpI family protein [Myxococcales bacterium]
MAWTLALVGLVMIGVSIPLAAERIGPNRWYGFRTPRVVKDERVWYPVNRMAGRNGIVFGLLLWAAALLGGLGIVGPGLIAVGLPIVLVLGLISTFVSAAGIVQQIDAGGPRIDYRSSFEKSRQHDAESARKKLLDKLK